MVFEHDDKNPYEFIWFLTGNIISAYRMFQSSRRLGYCLSPTVMLFVTYISGQVLFVREWSDPYQKKGSGRVKHHV